MVHSPLLHVNQKKGSRSTRECYYLEILDENPDDADETMQHPAELLLEMLLQTIKILIVGDGKTYTYEHLIKNLYGS